MEDRWLLEKMSHFNRELTPERRMHAKGSGAYGIFTVTGDITKYTQADLFSKIGQETPVFVRFSTTSKAPPSVMLTTAPLSAATALLPAFCPVTISESCAVILLSTVLAWLELNPNALAIFKPLSVSYV